MVICRARRAEGHADRDLTPLSDGAHDQQVREVDARDHQHEPDGAEHDQQRWPHPAHDFAVQRRDRGREIAVGVRAAPAEIVREDAQLLARALDRDIRLQASHDADAAPAARSRRLVEGGRHEEVDRVARAVLRQGPEFRRHDTDHLVRLAVEREHASEDLAIAAELPAPEPVHQDDHAPAARGILIRAEHAADRGRGAEHGEEIRGHILAAHLDRDPRIP